MISLVPLKEKWANLFGDWRTRRIAAIFTLLLLGGFLGMVYQTYSEQTAAVPDYGGRYVEGIVGTRTSLTEAVTRLTSAGLVAVTAEREYLPSLAQSWEIVDGGKTYKFNLSEGLDSTVLALSVKELDIFKTVTIETPAPSTIIFRLKQPYGPFMSLLSLPLFPFGPFVLQEEKEQEVTLIRNETFAGGAPFLEKIIIHLFTDHEALQRAVARRELTGAVTEPEVTGWFKYEAKLPRTIAAFFNTDRAPFNSRENRQKIILNEVLPEKTAVTIITSPQLKTYAEDLGSQWQAQNLEASVRVAEDADLKQNVIPKRDYDILIYGLDAGIDPDPFRFWHSSQVGGNGLNLSQVKDGSLDLLLEEARLITDDSARFTKYADIERKIDELALMIPLREITATYYIHPRIKGVIEPLMSSPASRYNLVWKWYTRVRRELKK